MTWFLAELEPATGRLTYVNCGHVPPLLVGTGVGEVEPGGGDPILGVFEDDFTLVLLARKEGG